MSHTRTSPRQKSRKRTAWKPRTPTVPRCDYCGVQGCAAECAKDVAAQIQSELDYEVYGMSREDYMREQQEFIEQIQFDEWLDAQAGHTYDFDDDGYHGV